MNIRSTVLFIVILLLMPIVVHSQEERIISFSSMIRVHTDASVTVSEEITVYASGNEIQRGIYRSLPVSYRDQYGNRYRARYEILDVQKNGVSEPYHVESDGDFKIVYIGDEDVYLDPGEYTYTISYRSPRQVRFFEDYDELYWNVTGNAWGFRIERSEVSIKMPYEVNILSEAAYTGSFGESGSDYVFENKGNGELYFAASRPLMPYEGITIAFSFPKGIIAEPTGSERFGDFLLDNIGTVVAVILLLLTFVYYVLVWMRVGRDPKKGAIPVLYFPPQELSPGAMRYILKMGFDKKAFTAAIVQMAVKKYLVIHNNSGEYTLKKTGALTDILNDEEKLIATHLFGGNDTVLLKNSNHRTIGEAISKYSRRLRELYQKENFFPNTRYFWPGILSCAMAVITMFVTLFQDASVFGPTIWVMVFGGGTILMGYALITTWRKASSDRKALPPAIIFSIFSAPFFLGFIIVGALFFADIAFLPLLTIILFVVMVVVFHHLLKAPTIKGRKLMDQIEGFREFLNTAEKDEMNLRNPPEKTPELFERYLPYAIALNVESHWGSRFDAILKQAIQDNSYSPGWYTGAYVGTFSAASFAGGLGSSFSSAVSSSSVAPSSSGSGGGGFSGGGGGGGGGGGW